MVGGRLKAPAFARVLVDGMWDNPNYYFRYAELRSALGLAEAQETGLLGRYNSTKVERTFAMMGIGRTINLYDDVRPEQHRQEARRLLEKVQSAEDLAALPLPYGYPALLFYDGLLRRQRRGAADPQHPALVDHLAEQLACLHAADQLIERGSYDFVVLSHVLNFDFSSLAWAARRRGVPTVVLYGDYGSARFIKVGVEEDFFDYINRPTADEMDAAPEKFRTVLRARGDAYLKKRFQGESGDIGATYAYVRANGHVSRQDICKHFGWQESRPLITVYASNWFDFPHACQMKNYLDFQEWITETARIAVEVPGVNWLFKPHPCDDWYPSAQGETVADIVAAQGAENVQVVPRDWNALSLMRAIDGGITYHGTIGLELTALGKPVLVADTGFYGKAGFVVYPGSRANYEAALRRPWWEGFNAAAAAVRAKEFVGWYLGQPDWHGSYSLPDDSEQDRIYHGMPDFLEHEKGAIEQEIGLIQAWMNSSSRYFHTFKIMEEGRGWGQQGGNKGVME